MELKIKLIIFLALLLKIKNAQQIVGNNHLEATKNIENVYVGFEYINIEICNLEKLLQIKISNGNLLDLFRTNIFTSHLSELIKDVKKLEMLKKEIQHDTPTYKCNIINVQLALLDAIKKIDMIKHRKKRSIQDSENFEKIQEIYENWKENEMVIHISNLIQKYIETKDYVHITTLKYELQCKEPINDIEILQTIAFEVIKDSKFLTITNLENILSYRYQKLRQIILNLLLGIYDPSKLSNRELQEIQICDKTTVKSTTLTSTSTIKTTTTLTTTTTKLTTTTTTLTTSTTTLTTTTTTITTTKTTTLTTSTTTVTTTLTTSTTRLNIEKEKSTTTKRTTVKTTSTISTTQYKSSITTTQRPTTLFTLDSFWIRTTTQATTKSNIYCSTPIECEGKIIDLEAELRKAFNFDPFEIVKITKNIKGKTLNEIYQESSELYKNKITSKSNKFSKNIIYGQEEIIDLQSLIEFVTTHEKINNEMLIELILPIANSIKFLLIKFTTILESNNEILDNSFFEKCEELKNNRNNVAVMNNKLLTFKEKFSNQQLLEPIHFCKEYCLKLKLEKLITISTFERKYCNLIAISSNKEHAFCNEKINELPECVFKKIEDSECIFQRIKFIEETDLTNNIKLKCYDNNEDICQFFQQGIKIGSSFISKKDFDENFYDITESFFSFIDAKHNIMYKVLYYISIFLITATLYKIIMWIIHIFKRKYRRNRRNRINIIRNRRQVNNLQIPIELDPLCQ